MNKGLLIGILLGVVFILIYSLSANAYDMEYKMVQRAMYYNNLHVKWSRKLDYPEDVATDEQIYNRVNSLCYWVQYYHNDNKYSVQEIELTLYSIVEVESGWANYKHQDNKTGFGLGAMQHSTAKIVADMLDEGYNEYKLSNDTHKQIQYIVYWFYYLLDREKDINKAIVAYNKGSVYGDKRIEQYFFLVKGRKEYFEELFCDSE